jgi:endoglucanase
MDKFVNNWIMGKSVHYTPLGLAMVPPNGTLGLTANAAFLTMLYNQYQGSPDSTNYCWARSQVSYMLGDKGKSFVVGFGDQFPRKVPHRAASCPDPGEAPRLARLPRPPSGLQRMHGGRARSTGPASPPTHSVILLAPAGDGVCTWDNGYLRTGPNPHVLYGALVGGPNKDDSFMDDRNANSSMNAVSLLNNAGFTATLAGLKHHGISEAKCNQGIGIIQQMIRKSKGQRVR